MVAREYFNQVAYHALIIGMGTKSKIIGLLAFLIVIYGIGRGAFLGVGDGLSACWQSRFLVKKVELGK